LRIALIGGTRFIGRAVVEDLAAAGHSLLLVHRGETEPDGLPDAEHIHTDRADLARHADALAAFRPDAALDCRAMSRTDAEIAFSALPRGIRLVVLSSIDVYRAFGALNQDRETDPVPIDEDSPVRSERYPYRDLMPGREEYDKLDVEDVYLPRGATSLRLPMVYGERDYQRREEFILRRVRAGRNRIPFGAGTWLACRGYVRDLAHGIRLALEKPVAEGEALNLCEDKTYSVRMWSRMILDAAGYEAELVRVADDLLPPDLAETGTMPQHIIATSARARALLGWRTSDLEKCITASVRWHLEHPPQDPDNDFALDDRALAALS
jgi:nucleoside-diphosphate-sugar epimerase